ncbi:MAG: hypothetical protein IK008_07370 [Bacteroidales bacterium]|nr:hypothetical protein [Bacteroidales bacterium]
MRRQVKVLFSIIVFSFLAFGHAMAQDVILTKDNAIIRAVVLSNDDVSFRYRLFGAEEGPEMTIEKSDVQTIRYASGEVWMGTASVATTIEPTADTQGEGNLFFRPKSTGFSLAFDRPEEGGDGGGEKYYGFSVGLWRFLRLSAQENILHPMFFRYGADVSMSWWWASESPYSIGSASFYSKAVAQWLSIQPYAVVHWSYKSLISPKTETKANSSIFAGFNIIIPVIDRQRIDVYKNGSLYEKGKYSDLGKQTVIGLVMGWSGVPSIGHDLMDIEFCIGLNPLYPDSKCTYLGVKTRYVMNW